METKDLIGGAFFFVVTAIGVVLTCLSFRARDAAFFLMLVLLAITFKIDVNFHSHYWYRGTTRGVEVSLVDVFAFCVLASSLLVPRPSESRFYWPASLGLMLLFIAYSCGNVFFSEPKVYGVFELSKMLRGIVFFLAAALFVRSERELAIFVFALCCAGCFEGVWALKQRLLDGIYRVPGTIDDPNSFSMYLCTISPIFVAAATSSLPRWLRWLSGLAIALTTISIVLTISRAGVAIFGFVMLAATALCVSWRLTPKKIAAVVLVLLCVSGLLFKQWELIKARWSNDSLKKEYLSKTMPDSRGYYLRLARVIADDKFFGVGLNNWSYWVSKKYSALVPPYEPDEDYDNLVYAPSKQLLPSFMYAAPAHNLAALTIGELGLPGLAIFALVWFRWFQMGASFLLSRREDPMLRLGVGILFGLTGAFLQSMTEWVFRQTHIFLTLHIMLGTLAALYAAKQRSKAAVAELTVEEAEEDFLQYEATIG